MQSMWELYKMRLQQDRQKRQAEIQAQQKAKAKIILKI